MRKYKGLLISSIILIVVGLLGITFLGFFASGFNKGMPRRFNQDMFSDMDRHFIEQMIPHHEDAIAMANLAVTKAEHKELKTLAESIIETQSKEINDMASWYESWYGTEVLESENFNMGMMGSDMTDLNALENADIFDKEFIEQMIPHHQMAVMMASMLLNRTEHKEMQKLAQDIIRTQTEEIKRMNMWYNQWP